MHKLSHISKLNYIIYTLAALSNKTTKQSDVSEWEKLNLSHQSVEAFLNSCTLCQLYICMAVTVYQDPKYSVLKHSTKAPGAVSSKSFGDHFNTQTKELYRINQIITASNWGIHYTLHYITIVIRHLCSTAPKKQHQ